MSSEERESFDKSLKEAHARRKQEAAEKERLAKEEIERQRKQAAEAAAKHNELIAWCTDFFMKPPVQVEGFEVSVQVGNSSRILNVPKGGFPYAFLTLRSKDGDTHIAAARFNDGMYHVCDYESRLHDHATIGKTKEHLKNIVLGLSLEQIVALFKSRR